MAAGTTGPYDCEAFKAYVASSAPVNRRYFDDTAEQVVCLRDAEAKIVTSIIMVRFDHLSKPAQDLDLIPVEPVLEVAKRGIRLLPLMDESDTSRGCESCTRKDLEPPRHDFGRVDGCSPSLRL